MAQSRLQAMGWQRDSAERAAVDGSGETAPDHYVHAVDIRRPQEALPLIDDQAVILGLLSGFARKV
jgi:hypothetical protein